MKEGMKKEKRKVRREWYGKNWKWVVPCIVAIVLCSISISFIVSKLQQRITFNHLSDCVGSSITKDMTELVVPSNRCNSWLIKTLVLSEFTHLKSIEIGDRCFEKVNEVKLIGLNQLERVVIGMNSFTKEKNDYGNDANRKLYVKNCDALKELKIGPYSFSDYSVIEIENVNSLELIEIGDMNRESNSFLYASLELKSE